MKKCIYCGAELEDSVRFCPYCGKLAEQEEENASDFNVQQHTYSQYNNDTNYKQEVKIKVQIHNKMYRKV